MDGPSQISSGEREGDEADEGQRGFFGLLGSRIGKQRGDPAENLRTHEALLLLQNYEESGQGWFWSTDAKGRLTYITASVARLMGRASGQLLGTSFTELFLPVDSHGERHDAVDSPHRLLLVKHAVPGAGRVVADDDARNLPPGDGRGLNDDLVLDHAGLDTRRVVADDQILRGGRSGAEKGCQEQQ